LACDCDPGYDSYDCSERMCPYGVDPLFVDDENTARVSSWSIHFEDTAGIDGADGTWRLRFFDVFGEDWVTEPIAFNATCPELTAELEAIPNDAIDEGTVECTHLPDTDASIYQVSFTGNPGSLKIPEIVVLDESGRHTLKKSGQDAYTGLDTTVIYDSGITGEFYDYFGSKCGVTIQVANVATDLFGSVQEATVVSGTVRTLKSCLGDSNGVTGDNVGVENWDYGGLLGEFRFGTWSALHAYPDQFPHLVKLVNSAAASEYDGGVYAIIYWSEEEEKFFLSSAVDTSLTYHVFATDGILERVWHDTDVTGDLEFSVDELGVAYWSQYDSVIHTSRDFSCENAGAKGSGGVFYSNSSYLHNNCLEKGDFLVIPASVSGTTSENITGDSDLGSTRVDAQGTLNSAGLYEIMKISVEDYTAVTNHTEDRYQIVLDRPIFWDGAATAHVVDNTTTNVGIRSFYRFTPDMNSNTEEWVAPCANRGLCDLLTGLCTCFAGYTNENCDTQSALAV
ncbi:unnamed protein product, partial [Laminaria digitata]